MILLHNHVLHQITVILRHITCKLSWTVETKPMYRGARCSSSILCVALLQCTHPVPVTCVCTCPVYHVYPPYTGSGNTCSGKPDGSCLDITVSLCSFRHEVTVWLWLWTFYIFHRVDGEEGVQQAGVAGHLLDHPVLLLRPCHRSQLLLGQNEAECSRAESFSWTRDSGGWR